MGPYFPRRGQKPIGSKSNIRPPRPQFQMFLLSSQIEVTKVRLTTTRMSYWNCVRSKHSAEVSVWYIKLTSVMILLRFIIIKIFNNKMFGLF